MEQWKGCTMDNQQERLVSLDFIAGLFVGEGSFCFNIVRNRGRGLINPVFQVFMTDKDTVDSLYRSLQHHGLPGYYYKRNKAGTNTRDQYGIVVHGVKRLARYCDALLPLLTGEKKEAALVMHEFCAHRLSLHPKAGYGPKDVEFVRRMRAINGQRTNNKTSLEELPRILRDYTSDMGL